MIGKKSRRQLTVILIVIGVLLLILAVMILNNPLHLQTRRTESVVTVYPIPPSNIEIVFEPVYRLTDSVAGGWRSVMQFFRNLFN